MISSTTTRNTVTSRCCNTYIPALRRRPQAPFPAVGSPGGPPATAGLRWAVSLTFGHIPSVCSCSTPAPETGLSLGQYPTPTRLTQWRGPNRCPSGAGRGDRVLDRAAPRNEGGLGGARRAQVGGLRVDVRPDVGLGDEGQAGVGVRRQHKPAGQVE